MTFGSKLKPILARKL
jgi:hypothetical protein